MVLCVRSLHNDAGDYRTQFHMKAETIAEALTAGQYDFGFLHIKAVDDTGHDQQPVLKVCCHTCCPNSVPTINSWANQYRTAFCSTAHLWALLFVFALAATVDGKCVGTPADSVNQQRAVRL